MKIQLDAATTDSAARVTIQCPAKVNLFLEVLGKRDDGFHEIETLMCPISLCDELTASLNDSGRINLTVETPVSEGRANPSSAPMSSAEFNASVASAPENQRPTADPAWNIPADSSNLAYRAAEAVQKKLFGNFSDWHGTAPGPVVEHPGVDLILRKSIPAAAGLAGGSSNAAAVVTACFLLWAKWNRPVATQICQNLGSDVPFFLGSSGQLGMAMATGRGEMIAPLKCKPPLSFVLTHPPKGCSTPAIYTALRPRDTVRNSKDIRTACETSAPGQLENIGAALFNALQSAASVENEWIKIQLDLLRSFGFQYKLMSGSGSACFGLCAGTTEEYSVGSPSTSLPGFHDFQEAASHLGIERVFGASAWYQPSIEAQIGKQRNRQVRLLQ